MTLAGRKPNPDRSQVLNRNKVSARPDVPNVPFAGGPDLEPRAASGPEMWAEAGVIPAEGWPMATLSWWRVIRAMPHAVLWSEADWQFAQATAEVHARFAEGWKGYTGGELRQREKLLGVYMDARRDLRIKYVDPPKDDAAAAGENVVAMSDYRDL